MDRVYKIIPASSGVLIFFWGFLIFLVAVIAVTFANAGTEPAGIAVAVAVIVFVGGALGFFVYQSRRAAFSLTPQGLHIGPGLYGRTIPREKIDFTGIKVINLDIEKEYRPKWRMNGAGLPGYNAGWFRLYNKEKALLFLTDSRSIVYIPTKDNYAVLLSVREAYEMADAMKNWG